jgi:hypothetical protein
MQFVLERRIGRALRLNDKRSRGQGWSPVLMRGSQTELAPTALETTAFLDNLSRCRDGMKVQR